MNNSRNKILSILSIVLLLAMFASFATLRPGVAAVTNETHLYVTISPNPIGVGEQAGVVIWTDNPVTTASIGGSGANARYHNYTIQMFDPSGKMVPGVDAFATQLNCTLDIPLIFDTTASAFTFFTPTQVGTYTFHAAHATETHIDAPGTNENDTYLGATFDGSFVVTQTPTPLPRDSFPLPSEYWARPIENQNVYWFTLSSNWLNDIKDKNYQGNLNNRYQPDGAAPNSPHVMWTTPIGNGIDSFRFGGSLPGSVFYNNPPIATQMIMNGNLYYQAVNQTSPTSGEFKVVDLRTGNVLNDYTGFGIATPQFGMYHDDDNPNQHGVTPADGMFIVDNGVQPTYNTNSTWLGFQNGTQWIFYRVGNPDGVGDNALAQFAVLNDVPTFGAPYIGITGELVYAFVFNNGATIANPTGQDWQVREWNITGPTSGTAGGFDSITGTQNMTGTSLAATSNSRLDNLSDVNTGGPAVPVTLGGTQIVLQPNTVDVSLQLTEQNYTYRPFENYYLLCRNGTLPTAGSNATTPGSAAFTYFAISMQTQTINGVSYIPGQVMWMKNFNAPTDGSSIIAGPAADGVFTLVDKETGVISAYDMTTGGLLWTSPDLTSATAYPYTPATSATGCTASIAYGNLYVAGSSGMVYCYDLQTGLLRWGYQTPVSTTPGVANLPANIGLIADDKVYLGSYTMTSSSSLYQGSMVTCIDAWSGNVIWTLPGWGGAGGYASSDGYMTLVNYYNANLYVIGKGPSSITVNSAIGNMNQVTITGTMTDASMGSKIKGTGCVSDQNMGAWMAYEFGGAAKPANVTGVDVVINVVDPNGNNYVVGTTTCNTDGTYSVTFTPQIQGQYQVIASFAGTNSYYPAFAHSTAYVNTLSSAGATPTPTPISNNTQTYILGSTAAIIIALAIAAVILALVLKKRP